MTNFDGGWRFQQADAKGAQAAAFDDAGWRSLSVPHDWSIEGRHVRIEFDGVMANSEVYLNGESLGKQARPKDDGARRWDVTFAPGSIRAVARNGGARRRWTR